MTDNNECFEQEYQVLKDEKKRNKREKYSPNGGKKKRNTCFNCCMSILVLGMVLVIGIFATGFILGNMFLRDNVHEDLTVGAIFRVLGNINRSRGIEGDLIAADESADIMFNQTMGAVFLRGIDMNEFGEVLSDLVANIIDEEENDELMDELMQRLEEVISSENIDLDRITGFDYSRIEDMFIRVSGSQMRAFINDFVLNSIVFPMAIDMIEDIVLEFLPDGAHPDVFDVSAVDLEDILQIEQIIFYRDSGVAGINITTRTNLHSVVSSVLGALERNHLWNAASMPEMGIARTGLNFGVFIAHHLVLRPLLPEALFLSIDMPLSRASTPAIRLNSTDNYDWQTLLKLDDLLEGMFSSVDDAFNPNIEGSVGYTVSNIDEVLDFDGIIQTTGQGVPDCGRIALDVVAVAIEFLGWNHGHEVADCDCDENGAIEQNTPLFGSDDSGADDAPKTRVRLPYCQRIFSKDIYGVLASIFSLDTAVSMSGRFSPYDWTRWVPTGNTILDTEFGMYVSEFRQRSLRYEEEGFNLAYFLGHGFDINDARWGLTADDRAVLAGLEGQNFGDDFDISILSPRQVDILIDLMQRQYEDFFIDVMRDSFGLHEDVNFDMLFDMMTGGFDDIDFDEIFCYNKINLLINSDTEYRASIDHRMLAAIVGRLLDTMLEDGDDESGIDFPMDALTPRFTAITTRNERGRERDFAHIGVDIRLRELVEHMILDGDEQAEPLTEFLIDLLLAVLPSSILVRVELELTLDAADDDLADIVVAFGDMTQADMDRLFSLLNRFDLGEDFDIETMLNDILGDQVRDAFVEMNNALNGLLSFRSSQMIVPPVFEIMAGVMNETMGTELAGGYEYINGYRVYYTAGEELRRLLEFMANTYDLDAHFDEYGDSFDVGRVDNALASRYAIEGGAYALFDTMTGEDADADAIMDLINIGDDADQGLRAIAADQSIDCTSELDLILDGLYMGELIIAFAGSDDADEFLSSMISADTLVRFEFVAYRENHGGYWYVVYYVRLVLNINLLTLLEGQDNDEPIEPMLEFISRMLGYIYVTMTAPIQIVREHDNLVVQYIEGNLTGLLLNYNGELLSDILDDTNQNRTAQLIDFLLPFGVDIKEHEGRIVDMIYQNINQIMTDINDENNGPASMSMDIERRFFNEPVVTRNGTRLGEFVFRLTNIFDIAAGIISDDADGYETLDGNELREAINVIFNIEGVIDDSIAINEEDELGAQFEYAIRRAYAVSNYQLDEYGDRLEDAYGEYVPLEMDEVMAILTGDEYAGLEFADLIDAEYFKAIVWDDYYDIVPRLGSLYLAGMILSNWYRFMDDNEFVSEQDLRYTRLFYSEGAFFITIGLSLVLEEFTGMDESDEPSLFNTLLTNSEGDSILDDILVSITIDVTLREYGEEALPSTKQFNSTQSSAVETLISIVSGDEDALDFDDVADELRYSLHGMMENLAYGEDGVIGFDIAYCEYEDERVQINVGSDEYEAFMRLPNIFELMKTLVYSDYYDCYETGEYDALRDITGHIIQETMRAFYEFDYSNPDRVPYNIRNAIAPAGANFDIEVFASTLIAGADFEDIALGSVNVDFSDRDLGRLIYGDGREGLGTIESVTILPSGYILNSLAVAERAHFDGHTGGVNILARDTISATFSFDARDEDVFMDNIDDDDYYEESTATTRLARRLLPELVYLSVLIYRTAGGEYVPIGWRINMMRADIQAHLYTLLFMEEEDARESIEMHTQHFGADKEGLFAGEGQRLDDEGYPMPAGIMYSVIARALPSETGEAFNINLGMPFIRCAGGGVGAFRIGVGVV